MTELLQHLLASCENTVLFKFLTKPHNTCHALHMQACHTVRLVYFQHSMMHIDVIHNAHYSSYCMRNKVHLIVKLLNINLNK